MLRKKNIASQIKKPTIYSFIDSQNLNLGTSKDLYRGDKIIYKGWKLDFKKFRRYLFDKFRVTRAFLFIGYLNENQKLYQQLKIDGFDLVFKPTVTDIHGKTKGNVDAELVLHASAIEFSNYDQAVIVSGDGDFRCLHEFLENRGKLKAIIIPNVKTASSLLKVFEKYQRPIIFDREKLESTNKN